MRIIVCLALVFFACVSLAEEQADSIAAWKSLPNMTVPRWEAGTVVLDNKLYVFGGYEMPTKSSKRADVFDPIPASWRKLAEMPSAITHMNTVLDGRTIWYAGGFKDGYKGHAVAEVWRYDVDSDRFRSGPDLREPRAGGGLARIGRTLHFFGGLKEDRDTCGDNHWVLDLEDPKQWKNAKPMPQARNHFSTVVFNGKIYLIGGLLHHDSGQVDQARVDVYVPETEDWLRGPDLPKGHSHAEGSTLLHNGRIIVIGGMGQTRPGRRIDDEIIALNQSGEWEVIAKLPARLSSPVAAILDDKLVVGGGSPNGATPQPEMWMRPFHESPPLLPVP